MSFFSQIMTTRIIEESENLGSHLHECRYPARARSAYIGGSVMFAHDVKAFAAASAENIYAGLCQHIQRASRTCFMKVSVP